MQFFATRVAEAAVSWQVLVQEVREALPWNLLLALVVGTEHAGLRLSRHQ